MSTRHLVDPELLPMLDAFPAFSLDAESLPGFRQQVAAMVGSPEIPAGVTVTEHRVPGVDGQPDAQVLRFTPQNGPKSRAAILFIHGGGYVFGTARDATLQCAARALRHDCTVVAVDYRLAPETPFPGPLMDCYAALRWLHDSASALGIDREAISVLGVSAGGGLASALCLATRDYAGPSINALFLVYPMLDDRTGTDDEVSPNPHAGEFMWTAASNRFGWAALSGGQASPTPPHHFSPARADRLDGMPPTYVAVGALDLFINENIDFVRRLISAGVPCEFHIYPGAFHGFDAAQSRIGTDFIRDLDDAISRKLHDLS